MRYMKKHANNKKATQNNLLSSWLCFVPRDSVFPDPMVLLGWIAAVTRSVKVVDWLKSSSVKVVDWLKSCGEGEFLDGKVSTEVKRVMPGILFVEFLIRGVYFFTDCVSKTLLLLCVDHALTCSVAFKTLAVVILVLCVNVKDLSDDIDSCTVVLENTLVTLKSKARVLML